MKALIFALLLLLEFNWLQAQFPQQFSQCYNPNNHVGYCVPVRHCGNLLSLLTKQHLRPNEIDFLRSSKCEGSSSNEIYVCCTPETMFITPDIRPVYEPATSSEEQFEWNDLPYGRNNFAFPSSSNDVSLPRPPTCGGVTIKNKIYGGQDAMLFEFPWMALLEYQKKNNQISFGCSGSLISKRYVLTAAHCVSGDIEKQVGPLIAVRLGEHNLNHQVDCDRSSCKADILRVSPEKIIPHEEYNEMSTNKQHDIALIRLDRNIRFSASVSPICLPSVMPGSLNVRSGTQFTVAGWGRTLRNPRSPVKQKLNIEFVEQSKCRKKFKMIGVDIVDTQICAGGQFAEDSCTGDSGGPLMNFRDGVWVLEGIVSWGFKCGLRDWPGVHTKAVSYESWIMRNIKA